ncbi:hypothetical protein [Pseudomonas viridiflava]|uniref:hypothetical protein n=1 Tax=Pseudomonas viridiflava TaxID=33069 RepID=UPI000F033BA0|nr:hypothetical protein [Pseudomonas viridiflava]MEE4126202.1 hypothetical protein [Pseudomonas viridiflava]QVI84882.1 hypothetical protein KHW14_21645 [Pseudomonas viridiflava]
MIVGLDLDLDLDTTHRLIAAWRDGEARLVSNALGNMPTSSVCNTQELHDIRALRLQITAQLDAFEEGVWQ